MPEFDEFGLVVSELKENDLTKVSVPFVLKNKILMSPGTWNNYFYDAEAIREAYRGTEWNAKNMALFLDHADDRAGEWVGEVKNISVDDEGNVHGDIVVVDQTTAIKLAYGAKFGVSPKVIGESDNNRRIYDFQFENFSIVINPAVKTTYLNSEIKEVKNMPEKEMQETPEEPKEEVKEEPQVNEMSEVKTLLKDILEELKKKEKYPYPEEQSEEELKKKKYPYPYPEKQEEAKPELSEEEILSVLDNSEYTKFVADFMKKHKGEGSAAELMKKAAKAWKEQKHAEEPKAEMHVEDIQKEVDKMIEQRFAEIRDPGKRIAQKFLEPDAKYNADDLDAAVTELLKIGA